MVVQMLCIGRGECGCIRAAHDPATLTPQESGNLRSQYEREGLMVSLVPAYKGIIRFCNHVQQQDLFTGVAP